MIRGTENFLYEERFEKIRSAQLRQEMNKQRNDRELGGNEWHRRGTLGNFMCCFPKLKAERRKLYIKNKQFAYYEKQQWTHFKCFLQC